MGAAERRQKIMEILNIRRHELISNLAHEFGVSSRTIRRDIEVLSLTEPIYTRSGRYSGGIYVLEGYHPRHMYMSEDEIALLLKIYKNMCGAKEPVLNTDDLKKYKDIIEKYTKPVGRKDKNE